MRREVMRAHAALAVALVSAAFVTGCSQSANARSENAAARARTAATVQQTETVKRVTIPGDSGRILYDAPTDLSLSNAIRTKAAIVGIDSRAQQPESAPEGGRPARARP